MSVQEVEVGARDDLAQSEPRSRVAVIPQPQTVDLHAELAERFRPVAVTAQIRDRDHHARGGLVPDQFDEVIFRAAAVDTGDDVEDFHAGASSVAAGAEDDGEFS